MTIVMVPCKTEGGKTGRLFLVALSPEETLQILNAPGGKYFVEPDTNTEFCIWNKPFVEEKDVRFAYGDGCYNFTSKTGFKTNEEHLNWLISLGEIPLGETADMFGKEKFITMGYVRFLDQRFIKPEGNKENPVEGHFLSKMLQLGLAH